MYAELHINLIYASTYFLEIYISQLVVKYISVNWRLIVAYKLTHPLICYWITVPLI